MSDLDADLYGGTIQFKFPLKFIVNHKFVDLYGNDESEFAVPTDSNDDKAHTETAESPKSEESPSKPLPTTSQVTAVKPSSSTAASETPATQSIPTSTSPPLSKPSPPLTQQIPTYQERQDTDYSQIPSRTDTNYSVPQDRPVRPSEMKEEGKYFSQFGKVEACTIMRDAAGRSRCFAFLTFEDPASVNAVMVREHFLDGKIIDPKRAIPRQEHQRATKLFIGGLAGSVTSESMREFFSQFGKVVDATVMLDRETGRSKGFGFVSFEGANVEPILGFGNLEIDGKLIDVKLAQPRSQRENFAENNQSGGGTQNFTGTQGSFRNQNSFGGGATTNTVPGTSGGNQTGGGSPFDPQALASLYTRMFQQMGGMNPMMGNMNMMGNGMGGGYGGGMSGGMGMPRMGGNPMGGGGMMVGMGMGGGMGMNRGGPGMGQMGGGMMGGQMNANIPRGPRGAPTGPGGGAGVGPQRVGQRGQHSFHPYAR
ncbi:hypothetical protein NLI96_g11507 [Meripilus lineatus]|uniref:RRM domain-containing protein n=1 Tax=Meripilus lineatus TaxID=2056292 RepID=A0AAD5URT9_9APHY|nr:hypothetical protein NLI96_g11507 [Physisporinus lineatus]